MVSFSMLCLTGLPQRYSDAGWAQAILGVFGGLQQARTVHHFFAVVLIAETLYHAVVVAGELILVRPRPTAMFPGVRDVRDGLASVAYLLGLRKEKPRYGRFDFRQKVEYWSMIWGTVVMSITGLILLFPVYATRFLPGVLLPASKIVHSYLAASLRPFDSASHCPFRGGGLALRFEHLYRQDNSGADERGAPAGVRAVGGQEYSE